MKVCVAKWNGTNWLPLDTEGGNTDVWAMASYNGQLYVGGGFTNFDGTNAAGIAQWNGSTWSSISTGFGIFDAVRALALFNNNLFIGGTFTTIGSVPANNIASWDGSNYSALAGGTNAQVQSLLSYGNKLFVGGTFWMVNSVSANRAAYWDGLAWTVLGTDLGAGAKTISIYNNELYYLGEGAFNGQNYAARWTGGTFSGIEENSNRMTINIFPNPTSGILNLVSDSFKSLEIKIFNTLGEIIYNQNNLSGKTRIDISNQPQGIYFYQLQSDKKILKTGKIIIE